MSEQITQQSKSHNHFNESEVATVMAALKLFQEHTRYMESIDVVKEFSFFFDNETLPPLSKYDLALLWDKIDQGGLGCNF